jgi:hypothetical protein
MEDVYRTLGGAVDLWDLPNSIDNDGFDATEFWLHHRSDKVEVKHRFVTPAERDAWLTTRFIASPTPGHDQSLLARFVWLVADSETRSVNLSDTSQKVLRKHFCLTLAHGFFKTFITGVTAFPRVAKPTEDRRAYAFCYGPKLAAIWSHARFAGATAAAEGITEGIIYARADPKNNIQQDQKPMLQTFLSMITINPHLARSSTFPVYLFSLLLGQQIDETQSEIRKAIRAVETRTGFHTFQSRKEMPNPAELMSLSATTSGHATKLAAVDRKSQMIDRLLKFIVTMVDEDEKHAADKNIPIPGATTELNQFSLLRHNVDVLKERLAMQSLDTQYTLTRVQIQIEAVSARLLLFLAVVAAVVK